MKYAHQIHQYLDARHQHEADSLTKETNIRCAFHKLIQDIAGKDFKTIQEQTAKTTSNKTIYYDLALLRDGMPWGLVEDKDARDNLDTEVLLKNRSQYDFSNMIFENGHEMLLFQDGEEVGRCVFFTGMLVKRYQGLDTDLESFDKLLQKFLNYIPKGARGYAESLEKFQESVPVLAADILEHINFILATDQKFRARFAEYMQSLRLAISEVLSEDDVKQMLVQHILTADLFKEILGSDDYMRFNTIARTLDDLAMNLGREFSHRVATDIRPYYHNLANNIRSMGSGNQFSIEVLRQFYETFYQAYDTKRADTYGIVYTPVQVVDFMVTMADSLLKEHFGKNIYSKNVHVLDPCVGTGSFMVSILEYIAQYARGELEHKFTHELHANELSILAYYIGNIHIELTFSRLSGGLFSEFNNMCYVDTLDNVYAIEKKAQQQAFSFAITEENARRVQAQNEKPLMLIIGNPPYNANQKNENQNNKNKRYQFIDERIKNTYSAASNAQKLKLTDMYVRFIRWATDRLGEEGMIAFITNRSFLDAFGFDGFRKTVMKEFSHIYCVDLGGDVRKDPRISGTKNNVFGIQTGVTISFLLKAPNSRIPEGIRYINPFDPLATKEDKFAWLSEHTQYNEQKHLSWQNIEPDEKGYWINQSTSDFESLLPLGDKKTKGKNDAQAIFSLFSLGIATNRDPWMYDYSAGNLIKKVQYFINIYQSELKRWQSIPDEQKGNTAQEKERFLDNFVNRNIKWNFDLQTYMAAGKKVPFNKKLVILSIYRPFKIMALYMDKTYVQRLYQMPSIFPTGARGENLLICATGISSKKSSTLITNILPCLDLLEKTQCFPLYRYGEDGHKISNITPAYRQKFIDALQTDVTDEQIFYYIYAMLHHVQYREDYKIDLTQNLPAVPISPDFFALSALGRKLGDLHVNFDTTEPYHITRTDKNIEHPLPKLRSKPESGQIIIDEATILSDIPSQAWEYKLGNRTAIDWVLEGYKVKKISADNGDIANPYSPLYTQYAYQAYAFTPEVKEECITLLRRIITVSLKTQELIEQISNLRMKE